MNSSIALIQHELIGMLVAVDINADGEACLPTAGGRFIGVCQSPMPVIGQAIPVIIEKCLVIEAGGVYAAGDYLSVDAAGKFVAAGALPTFAAPATPTGAEVSAYTAALGARVAIALEASTASGDRVQIIRL
jgi:hypothetical protein